MDRKVYACVRTGIDLCGTWGFIPTRLKEVKDRNGMRGVGMRINSLPILINMQTRLKFRTHRMPSIPNFVTMMAHVCT